MSKKIVVTTLIGTAVVLLGVAAWLLVSGKLTVAWNGSESQEGQASRVCGGDIVSTYNQATYIMPRNGSDEPSIDEKGVNKLAGDIKTRAGYEDDPTCQTILFWVAVENNNYEGAKKAHEALLRLHENNKFSDNNLRGGESLYQYGNIVESISPANQRGGGVSG